MNNGFPTAGNPKHSSYIKNIKEGLESAGHDVSLLVMDSNFKGKWQQLVRYLQFYRRIWNYKFSAFDYVFINHLGHFAIPMIKAWHTIKQPVLHWHGEDLYPKRKVVSLFFNQVIRRLPPHTLHITPSHYFHDQLAAKHIIPSAKIMVSPSGGIDTDLLAPLVSTATDNSVLRVGFASGLTTGKGAEMLLSLLQNLTEAEDRCGRKIEVHYIFYGSAKAKFDALLRSFAAAVRWDVMPTNEMNTFYRSIDVLLFPTQRKQESLGLVALEAMSCNVPVVATNAFAVPEYVQEGMSGEVFAIGNFNQMLEKLAKVAKNLPGYHPRLIIEAKYSRQSVVAFYRRYFK